MTAWPVLRIAVLALSIRYSVRLLSNSGVAGELRYLGPGRAALALAQDPAAEADGMAVLVADREDDARAELVVDAAAALARAGEADLDELLRRHLALRGQRAGHLVPAAGRPAELVLRDGLVGEAAAAEVVEGGLAGLRAGQDRVVEGDRALEDRAQSGVVRVLALGPLVDLDAGAGRQLLERLGERDGVALHHEAEDVAVHAAPEAVPGVACGVTTNDGVFSPWNGQSPLRVVPAFFSWTVSPTTSATDRRLLISATTPTANRSSSPVSRVRSGGNDCGPVKS